MSALSDVVIILMPLKLLKDEESAMINRIPNGKAVALAGDHNFEAAQREIACGDYTPFFNSPEIALTKKFKTNVLDNSQFLKRLCLLAINEIHLVDQWGKSFRLLYAEVENV